MLKGTYLGLGGIKGLGEGPIEDLLAAREEKPFADLFDLCSQRIHARSTEEHSKHSSKVARLMNWR